MSRWLKSISTTGFFGLAAYGKNIRPFLSDALAVQAHETDKLGWRRHASIQLPYQYTPVFKNLLDFFHRSARPSCPSRRLLTHFSKIRIFRPYLKY